MNSKSNNKRMWLHIERSGATAMLVVLAGLTFQGCTAHDVSNDLQQWTAQQLAQTSPSISAELLDERHITMPAEYQPNQVMPFALSRLIQALHREAEMGHAPSYRARWMTEQNRHKQELEHYPLDAMTMQGSLLRRGEIVALVKVHETLYPVRLGQYLGQNYGQVVQITERHIQLRELVATSDGDWVEKTSMLALSEGAS